MLNTEHLYCVIMAGGFGSRFWPASREARPKQFLDLTRSGESLLQTTWNRFSAYIPTDHIYIVTLSRFHDQVSEQLPDALEENILLEPYSRNTAPTVTLATYTLLRRDPSAVMIVTPADHNITDIEVFGATMEKAVSYATANDALITLGIVPTRPDTNFGYIQGKGTSQDGGPLKVKTFTEKPDAELAEVFFRTGEFYWNSGMFFWKASVIREELERYVPEITSLFDGWQNALGSSAQPQFLEKVYSEVTKISIDYAVMEKTDKAWLFPATFGWHDIGTWESLYNFSQYKDEYGNAVRAGKAIVDKSKGDIVYSDRPDKLIVVKGLDNYMVVDTGNVLMICPRDDADYKEVTAGLGMPGFEDYR